MVKARNPRVAILGPVPPTPVTAFDSPTWELGAVWGDFWGTRFLSSRLSEDPCAALKTPLRRVSPLEPRIWAWTSPFCIPPTHPRGGRQQTGHVSGMPLGVGVGVGLGRDPEARRGQRRPRSRSRVGSGRGTPPPRRWLRVRCRKGGRGSETPTGLQRALPDHRGEGAQALRGARR